MGVWDAIGYQIALILFSVGVFILVAAGNIRYRSTTDRMWKTDWPTPNPDLDKAE